MASACVPGTDGDTTYQILHQHGCAVVVTAGDIDIRSAPYLREALDAAAVMSDRLIIDLTHVQFIDSCGLGVLVGARRRDHARSVSLVRPPPVLSKLLHITRLGGVLAVYPSREDALDAVGVGSGPRAGQGRRFSGCSGGTESPAPENR
jgi:anti-sigma B factor antagonist